MSWFNKVKSLFSSDADHISFLSFENRTKKYYDNQLFTSSIAVVLSQILQLKIQSLPTQEVQVLYWLDVRMF